ncbi:hypothetical protein [Agrobacterium pusense]|uniref:hypothetical protein n=1 Tax=Agrobacterium pusense TaxID=648995 RepID=UPI0022B8E7E3|nr:hypothetical protein [Agrobacterium pusense]MCZ7926170.1 hypothetical protein [Agrobacterium pusense]
MSFFDVTHPNDIGINAMELLDNSKCLGFRTVPKAILFGSIFWADTMEDTSDFYDEVKSKYPGKFKMAPYTGDREKHRTDRYYRPLVVYGLTDEELIYATIVMGAKSAPNGLGNKPLKDLDIYSKMPSWQLYPGI